MGHSFNMQYTGENIRKYKNKLWNLNWISHRGSITIYVIQVNIPPKGDMEQ